MFATRKKETHCQITHGGTRIFIGMGVKITVYTEKYPEILFILLKYMQLLSKHP